ncbi:MAG: hypothetical protein N4A57_07575 [Anaeromicrobium sp.]|jgi:hypothetical protein|uniref:DUF6873 family GME fold protein n=1 Tax=Anaeromicrobium sp. TaxID=1929132 RepID=UPI0025D1BD19|nr:hypothetical protein [Anaeromicrobium sp.]MCT4594110.1 hypothetical protein [Anaeromicrobium sp.]
MKKALIDGRASEELIKNLEKLNIKAIKTPKCKELYRAICSHVDILSYKVDNTNVIVAPNIYDFIREELSKNEISPIKGRTLLKSNYPYDIAYNVARVGKYAIHNFKYTDKLVLEHLKKEEVELINVKQGYSKCSICVVNEKAVITSDRGIANTLKDYDIDLLLISLGHIKLDGLDHGFIGGCTGNINNKQLLFTGTLSNHPDENRILNFLKKHGIEPMFLSEDNLIDLGTIFIFG